MTTANAKVSIELTATDRATNVLQRLGKSMGGLGRLSGGLFDGAGANIAKTAAGLYGLQAVTQKLYGFAKGSADAAKEVKDLAEITGAASQDIQLLGSEMGGNMQSAATALAKLQRAKQLALTKGGDELDAFKAAGISVEDLRNKDPMGLLKQMADSFQGSNNAGGKLLITQKLLGKSSDGLVELLNKGSGELIEKQKIMERSGGMLSNRQLDGADKASETFKKLGIVFDGLKNTLGLGMAEKLAPLVEKLSEFLILNKDIIAQKFDVFIQHLPAMIEGVGAAFKVMVGIGKGVFKVFEVLGHVLGAKLFGGIAGFLILLPVLGSVISVMGAMVSGIGVAISGITRLYRAFQILMFFGRIASMVAMSAIRSFVTGGIGVLIKAFNALRVVMMANPFIAIATALGVAAYLIYSNWDSIVSYVSGAWERIKAVFDAQGFFGAMWQGVLELWQGGLNAIVALMKKIPFMDKLIGKDFKFEFADKRAEAITAGKVAKAQQQSFNGKLSIEVKGDKSARVTSMQSDNGGLKMDAKHGMAGAPA